MELPLMSGGHNRGKRVGSTLTSILEWLQTESSQSLSNVKIEAKELMPKELAYLYLRRRIHHDGQREVAQ
jgi:hypothetical protein